MLDWIFEGIITWVSSVVTDLMDAVSGMFLQALGTDMTAMEEYFPFVSKAFTVMQYTAWALLFLITVWQLFRVFGGPVTDAENPWTLIGRSAMFALLIGYSKPIFSMCLDIATAPYTALMDIQMTAEDFTFAGVEAMLMNGLTTLIATISVVGLLLLVIWRLHWVGTTSSSCLRRWNAISWLVFSVIHHLWHFPWESRKSRFRFSEAGAVWLDPSYCCSL